MEKIIINEILVNKKSMNITQLQKKLKIPRSSLLYYINKLEKEKKITKKRNINLRGKPVFIDINFNSISIPSRQNLVNYHKSRIKDIKSEIIKYKNYIKFHEEKLKELKGGKKW